VRPAAPGVAALSRSLRRAGPDDLVRPLKRAEGAVR
jgi:hypothetical protein